MMTTGCYNFCQKTYSSEYERRMAALMSEHQGKKVSDAMVADFDKESQKAAIKQTITQAIQKYPNEQVSELWKSIYRAHLFRKSGISDIETIEKVISADQSWKKSSGHAFEEMVKELVSLTLHGTGIEIVLQRDLNILIKANEIANEPRDISWLKEQIRANIFDLYSIVTINDKKYCFGCIQAKTSIRDRVTRDREPSIHAMQSFFWSVIFVLDGDFLRLPKFVNMVNGGSEEFKENGWHGMYVFSTKEQNDRIYPLTMDFEIFKNHTIQAAWEWQKQRQWFDRNWKAK
ncbi:MAG: hypothetical protein IJ745_00835 [Bacteroidales bacterium]|nr:hypothetical protein [Bacteroidales bacterium]